MAGFNDLAGSEQMLPALTTVRTPRSSIGEASARMLLSLIAPSLRFTFAVCTGDLPPRQPLAPPASRQQ